MATQRKLGRTADQRKALLRNQVTNLIWYGRIETTLARAKEVRSVAEKMITLEKPSYLGTDDRLAERFYEILIDEYQDLGRPLHEMVLSLIDNTNIKQTFKKVDNIICIIIFSKEYIAIETNDEIYYIGNERDIIVDREIKTRARKKYIKVTEVEKLRPNTKFVDINTKEFYQKVDNNYVKIEEKEKDDDGR